MLAKRRRETGMTKKAYKRKLRAIGAAPPDAKTAARAFARADDPELLATLDALKWEKTLNHVIAVQNAMLAKRRREKGMTKQNYQSMLRSRGAAPPKR